MNKLKPSLAALGLSAALAAGSTSAALTIENGQIRLEDDDIDFVLNADLSPKGGGILEEDDVLFNVVEFVTANGDNITDITGLELTGVAAGQIVDITGNFITFGAYSGGLNSVLSAFGGPAVPAGDEGALIALWLGEPDLSISSDLLPGPLSCDTIEQCVAQATDGELWEVDGFTGPDGTAIDTEFWTSVALTLDTDAVLATDPAAEVAFFNAGGAILFDGSGLGFLDAAGDATGPGISCFPINPACAPGDTVEVLLGGSIKGGDGLSDNLIADGAIATSDFDLVKTAVPEPNTLALLAAGLIGVGAARRRKAKA